MGRREGHTARKIAILMPASAPKMRGSSEPLSKEIFLRELNYQTTAALVRTIFRRQLIGKNEMFRFLQRLIKRFQPILGRLGFEVMSGKSSKDHVN